MTHALFTIGYEGSTPDEFAAALTKAGIKTLLDIRAIAWSRKPGFSSEALRAHLAGHGIAYAHIEVLGNPQKRGGRPANDMRSYQEMYNSHLDTPPAQEALKRVADMARAAPSCLLCFERDPGQCHRSLTAARMGRDFGFAITHLTPEKETGQLSLL
jgi:uncharacterized protein (DUF488 family)